MARWKDSIKFFGCALLSASILLTSGVSFAQNRMDRLSLIRDVEIENTLREWTSPVFVAAGLNPDAVNIILVENSSLNAFVAGGSNIFLYTGVILATDTPGELIGVIAHESGHIAGGHLVRLRTAMERASYESIMGAILGVGAAIATGNGGAAVAVATGSGSVAQRSYLAHSRIQESSADQAALTFMEAAKINPSGMASFMEKLRGSMYLPADQQIEYVLTHPLVENRIDALQSRTKASAYKDKPFPPAWTESHARMKAKLLAFINPAQVAWTYADSDQSVAARYARAIAAYRNNQVDDALIKMDDLLKAEPKNPYFLELKGQMLVEFGRVDEGVPYYRKAIAILPKAALLRISLAHALIESHAANGADGRAVLGEAVENLERAKRDEPRATRIFRLLATAYGKMGDENMAKVNLAEEAVLQQRYPYAREQAEGVIANAPKSSPAILKAKDVLTFIERQEKE